MAVDLSLRAFPLRFGSRYVLLKKLAEGGMGAVYLALSGQRLCALKLLRASETNPDIAKRLVDEGRLATKLSHPCIVYAFDAGFVQETPYIALEYLRGKTLYETLSRKSSGGVRLPLGLLFYLTKEILRGLEYLHNVENLRLVHRDLSPANVMVTYDGAVKIIDLGLARWIDKTSATMAGNNWGQERYQSPEQYAGQQIDRRSDIFTVGVLLWEMVTRKRLFDKNAPRDPNAALPAPSTFIPGLSQEVDALVMTALARNPDHRYQNARDFIKELSLHIEPEDDAAAVQAFMSKAFEAELGEAQGEEKELVALGENLSGSTHSSRRWLTLGLVGLGAAVAIGSGTYGVQRLRQKGQQGAVGPLPGTVPENGSASSGSTRDAPPQIAPPVAAPAPAETAVAVPIPRKAKRSQSTPMPRLAPGEPNVDSVEKLGAPQNTETRGEAAVALIEKGRSALSERRVTDAIEAGLAALERGGGASAHALLGAAYQGLNQEEAARKHLEQAVALDPNDAASRRRLQFIRRNAGLP